MASPVVIAATSVSSPNAAKLQLSLQVYANGAVAVFTSGPGIPVVTDSQGNSYGVVGGAPGPAGLFAFVATAGSSGIITVTVQWGVGADVLAAAVSLSPDAAPPVDAVGPGHTGTNATGTDTVVTGQASDLLLLAVATTGPNTFTAGSGDTMLTQTRTGEAALGVESAPTTVAGSYSPAMGISAVVAWSAIAVAFAPAASAPLMASAVAVPAAGPSPLPVQFTGGASGGTAPYTWSWNFGDGHSSALQSPSHTYASPGTFTATLTVTDSVPNTAQAHVSVKVSQGGQATTPGNASGRRLRPGAGTAVGSKRVRLS